MENNSDKVTPYQRLQAILSEGKSANELKLTNKGHRNLDILFNKSEKKSKESFFTKIKDFFIKIDSKIFSEQRISNVYQRR